MTKLKNLVSTLATCLTVLLVQPSQAQEISGFRKNMDQIVLNLDATRPLSGILAIRQNNKSVYALARGLADREQSLALNYDNQYIIGSISKQITAALILKAAERGQIDLHAPASRYLPYGPVATLSTITVHQLLNHTSGIRAIDKALQFEPGSQFAYSNYGYNLLGEMLAQQTGKSYAQLANEIFAQCKMPNTTAVPVSQHQPKQLAVGYNEQKNGSFTPTADFFQQANMPSGGIISNFRDLYAWQHCLHETALLTPEHYQAMTTGYGTRKHRWGDLGYGYGLQISEQDGLLEYSHSAYVPGYIATMLYYPESKTSVVILENIAWSLRDIFRVFELHDKVRQEVRRFLLPAN